MIIMEICCPSCTKCVFHILGEVAGAGFDMVVHILNEGFAESLNYQAGHIQKPAWSASGPVSGS